MPNHRPLFSVIDICFVIFIFLGLVPKAQAGIFYNVEVKGIYEDNVIGLLSDKRGGTAGVTTAPGPGMMSAMSMTTMGGQTPQYVGSNTQSNSDTSINLFADLGNSLRIAEDTLFFVAGGVQHTSYSTFTQFDSTIAGLSTGINKGLGDITTARFAINGAIKRYNDSQRNSSAYGANLSLKERLTPSFWLKESYDYEKNDATSSFFSYQGNAASIWAGYLAVPRATVFLGYNYLVRNFDQPSDFKVTAQTISLGLEWELMRKWYFDAQYDHQISDSNVPGTNTTDNIYSIGLRYSY
jgi:hypothetical protein